MKRYMMCVSVLLAAGLLASCGGGGGGDSPGGGPGTTTAGSPGTTTGGNPPPATGGDNPPPATGGNNPPPTTGGNNPPPATGGSPPPPAAAHFEQTDAAVTLIGAWKPSDPHFGWSGGTAVKSEMAGDMASFTFTGTSVRWLASRGRGRGIASVRVDGGPAIDVDLFARPNDEIRTPAITIDGLSPGPHTLTIEVTGRKNAAATSTVVEVDAFDVQPQIVSHIQEMDPDITYSGTWAQAENRFFWSGSGAGNVGDPEVGAKVTESADASVKLEFRGTSIKWIGYRGPDGGIARVTIDGVESEIDTYAETFKIQEVLFTKTDLADASHTLTIEATGLKNTASTAARIFVDAFDVTMPGRRYQAEDPALLVGKEGGVRIRYDGAWNLNDARVWSEGLAKTSNQTGASVTFSFTGTGVSWIGCEKASIGRARIFLDGVFKEEVNMSKPLGIEGFQRSIYRVDGLTNGAHELKIEVSSTNGAFVVVDAFDVRQ